MDLGKISFFKRLHLAITDFRMYPFALKENLGRAIGYFIKLIILVSAIMGVFFTSKFFKLSEGALETYKNIMPEFSVENGKLQIEEAFEEEINDSSYLIVNPEYNYSKINDIVIEEENEHDYYILVLEDATTIGVRSSNEIMELITIPYEDISFTKMELSTEWQLFNNELFSKMVVWVVITIGILMVLIIVRLWSLLMYIVSALIINLMFGLKLKITDYLKIVIYASTLPIILEIIAIIVVGGVSQAINFISILVSIVYIFYALREIKIDAIILGGTGKVAEEKMKSALLRAKEELTKQLEELEKKEEEIQKNGDENSEELKQIKELEEINKELIEKEENLFKAKKEYEETIKKVIEFENKSSDLNEEDKATKSEESKSSDLNEKDKATKSEENRNSDLSEEDKNSNSK